MIQCLTAHLERKPTQKEMLQLVSMKALSCLDEALMRQSSSLDEVLMKVLSDVDEVSHRRVYYKKKKAEYRQKHNNVHIDVLDPVHCIDKISLELDNKSNITQGDSLISHLLNTWRAKHPIETQRYGLKQVRLTLEKRIKEGADPKDLEKLIHSSAGVDSPPWEIFKVDEFQEAKKKFLKKEV